MESVVPYYLQISATTFKLCHYGNICYASLEGYMDNKTNISNLFSHNLLLIKCLIPCEGSSWASVVVDVVTVDTVLSCLVMLGLNYLQVNLFPKNIVSLN